MRLGIVRGHVVLNRKVPNLEGLSYENARKAVGSYGFKLVVSDEVHDAVVKKGHVIEQDVEAGTSIKGKTDIVVVLSKGPVVRLIPSAIGKTVEKAKSIGPIARIVLGHSAGTERLGEEGGASVVCGLHDLLMTPLDRTLPFTKVSVTTPPWATHSSWLTGRTGGITISQQVGSLSLLPTTPMTQ